MLPAMHDIPRQVCPSSLRSSSPRLGLSGEDNNCLSCNSSFALTAANSCLVASFEEVLKTADDPWMVSVVSVLADDIKCASLSNEPSLAERSSPAHQKYSINGRFKVILLHLKIIIKGLNLALESSH